MSDKLLNRRLKSLKYFFIFVTIFYVWYLAEIHFSNSLDLDQSVTLRYKPKKKILYPKRGDIYDRNGKLLVGSNRLYQLDIDLGRISRIAKKREIGSNELIAELSKIVSKNLGINKRVILRKFRRLKDRGSCYLGEQINETTCSKLETDLSKIKLKSLLIKKYTGFERYYPAGSIAKRLFGNIHQDKTRKDYISIYGETGIEKSFDTELSGKTGWREYYETASRSEIKYPLRKMAKKEAVNGSDLYLTIDYDFQRILDKEIYNGVKKYQAENGYGVFIDVKTGEVLAMASCSKNDLLIKDKAVRQYNDLNIVNSFEPGSTFKPFMALLALESGKVKPNDMIDCSALHEYKRVITDHHPFKKLTFKNVIAYSSNPGISRISDLVGIDKFYQRLLDLGFKYKTNIQLPYESSGLMRNKNKWNISSLHSISFGQEISVTSIQLVTAYAALANGGKVIQPKIWLKTTDKNGKIVKEKKMIISKVISNKTSLDTLKTFLRAVVEYGTATKAEIEGLEICGKTGTAQKSIKGHIGYSEKDYYSVFAGFFPYQNPKIAGVIVYDSPIYKYHFGSAAAVPTFRNTVKKYIELPSTTILSKVGKNVKKYKVPDVESLSYQKMKKKFQKYGIKFKANQKEGFVMYQIPQPGAKIPKDEKVLVYLQKENKNSKKVENDEKYLMPNLIGLPIRNAIKKAYSSRVRLKIKGSGIIYQQGIKPGTKINFEDICEVKAK